MCKTVEEIRKMDKEDISKWRAGEEEERDGKTDVMGRKKKGRGRKDRQDGLT